MISSAVKFTVILGILAGSLLGWIQASSHDYFRLGFFYNSFSLSLKFICWATAAFTAGSFLFFGDLMLKRPDLKLFFSILFGFFFFLFFFPAFSCFPWSSTFSHLPKRLFLTGLFGMTLAAAMIRHMGSVRMAKVLSGKAGNVLLAAGLLILAGQIGGRSILDRQNSRCNEERNNVIIVLLDALRADHLHCYGYFRETSPWMDRLADEGTLFVNVFAQAPVTFPSVYCLLTSRRASEFFGFLGRKGHLFPADRFLMLPEIFQNHGYTTAAISSSPLVLLSKPAVSPGGRGYGQGFRIFEELTETAKFRSPEAVMDRAIHFLDQYGDRRFFLYLHLMDPHDPYKSPEPFNSRFLDPAVKKTVDLEEMALKCNTYFHQILDGQQVHPQAGELEIFNALYDGEIRYADSQIGRLVKALESRKLNKNTLLLITADHGEEFFEHGFFKHCYNLHNEALKIPFIIRGPGVAGGIKEKTYVQSIDIAPTLMTLAGIPKAGPMQGEDLARTCLLGEPPSRRRPILCESQFLDAKCLITGDRWKYIRVFGKGIADIDARHLRAAELIYDLVQDPEEKTDLFEKKKALAAAMRRKLLALLPDSEKQRLEKRGMLRVDPQTREHLKAIGYLY